MFTQIPTYTGQHCKRCDGSGIWRNRGICFDCGGNGVKQVETGSRAMNAEEQTTHDSYMIGQQRRAARAAEAEARRVARESA